MKMKASMLVMSHLSDSQEIINMGGFNLLTHRTASDEINFAKFVILYCKGDLNMEVDADVLWENFKNKMK